MVTICLLIVLIPIIIALEILLQEDSLHKTYLYFYLTYVYVIIEVNLLIS